MNIVLVIQICQPTQILGPMARPDPDFVTSIPQILATTERQLRSI